MEDYNYEIRIFWKFRALFGGLAVAGAASYAIKKAAKANYNAKMLKARKEASKESKEEKESNK